MPLFVKIIHLIYAIFGDGRKQKTGSLLSYAIEHTTHNTQHTTHKTQSYHRLPVSDTVPNDFAQNVEQEADIKTYGY